MNPDDRPTVTKPRNFEVSWLLLAAIFLAGIFLGITFKEFFLLLFGALAQVAFMGRRA